jgi:hypothetical protein
LRKLFGLVAFALFAAAFAPDPAAANCNLIPAVQREFRSTLGTVDRTLVAPGSRIAVRTDLACNPTGERFASDPAQSRVFVRFVPPAAGGNPGLETELAIPTGSITPANCAIGGRCDTLLFFFPDAATLDAALAPDGDGLGPTGPVRVRVENLAAQVLVNVGPLYEPTLGCDDQEPESVFGHLTALPEPNSFDRLANATDTTLEATVDGNGNLLIPVDYASVFPGGAGSAVFRILEASAPFDAFAGNPGVPITIPDSRRLRSFNLAGRPIPPVLETNAAGDTVLGSVDAQLSVLRIARFDPDAPGPPLYDATDRLFAQKGPIQIAGASANARESAPLSSLSADSAGIAFASVESFGNDLNGDGDFFDRVPQVIDVASGQGTNTGDAVTEVTTPGYAKPVLQSGDGFIAYGASEGRNGYASGNGDIDRMDSLLRVFDTAGDERAADETICPVPVVDGKAISISNGLVFHRTDEADGVSRATTGITPTILDPAQQRGDSEQPSLSGDGRYVAFQSLGGRTFTSVAPQDGFSHIYLQDRETGDYELIDRTPGGVAGDRNAFSPSISRDGRWVAYHSEATNLPGADADGFFNDVYLYDRQTQDTVCPSCGLGASDAFGPDLSGDASHLAYALGNGILIWERASGTTSSLLAEFPPFSPDADYELEGITPSISDGGRYVVERFTLRLILGGMILTDQVMRFDRQTLQVAFIAPGDLADISADGSVISFQSFVDLVTDDTNAAIDQYVWDERQGIELLSVNTDGVPGNGGVFVRSSRVSDDGRFVAFVDDSGGLVQGVSDGRHVFRYDRTTNVVEVIDVSSGGALSTGFKNTVAISGDGQTVAFAGFDADGITPDTYTDIQNVWVRSSAGASLNAADSDVRDTVLQVYDPAAESYVPSVRVPASVVAVSTGRAAILSSEADDGGVDRNGDGDSFDRDARIVDGVGGTVEETGLAAGAVAISDAIACIAVDEAAQNGLPLNGDGDADDLVLFVHDLATSLPTNTGIAVSAANLAAVGTRCIFTTPESAEAGTPDLNVDGDLDDAVLGVYDAATAIPASFPYATEDLVAKGDLVAFRVCEDAQGPSDLNFDGDVGVLGLECIMHVLRLSSGDVENTERAAEACRLPGCDPFFEPYRVTPSSVSFLMSEFQQSGVPAPPGTPLAVDCQAIPELPNFCDLSDDGDADDRMISVYGVLSGRAQLIPMLPPGATGQDVAPFPTEVGESGVLYVQVLETQIGEDVNGDGAITPTAVLVLVGDTDGDGTLDDAVNRNDTCIEVANAAQSDADRDQLGDGACDPAPTPSLPGDVTCDVDGNGQIDRFDAEIVFGDRGTTARASDPRDADGDGAISVLDVSACRALCTYPACRPSPPVGGCGIGAEIAAVLAGLAMRRRRIR